MSENKYFEILDKVYKLTDNTTPRRFDCGELCGKRCCFNLSKDGNTTGMSLLPYEKELLISKGASYIFAEGDDGNILICNSACKRELRPFACRIFPYYIDVNDDEIQIKKDLRAANVCPLLMSKICKRADVNFLRNIKKAARLLLKDELFKDELIKTSDFINCIRDLYSKLDT